MRFFLGGLVVLLFVPACAEAPELEAPELPVGRWTGEMTPMRHPEMKTSIAYRVADADGAHFTMRPPGV